MSEEKKAREMARVLGQPEGDKQTTPTARDKQAGSEDVFECGQCGRREAYQCAFDSDMPDGWCRIEDGGCYYVCCSAQCAVDCIEASPFIAARLPAAREAGSVTADPTSPDGETRTSKRYVVNSLQATIEMQGFSAEMEELVSRAECHDELVAALKGLRQSYYSQDEDLAAVEAADAALAKAGR